MRCSTLATALALVAVPSVAAADLNLVVSGDVDPDLVRMRIVEELGTPTTLVEDPAACASPCLDVAISGEQAKSDLLGEKQPSGEFATPEQIGAACLFLCSDAATQVRGIALPVDGGWIAQ